MSNERFVRCPHCGLPHSVGERYCPSTKRPIPQKEASLRPPSALLDTTPDVEVRRASLRPAQNSQDLLEALVGGQYVVRRLIGRGGMASVYEAEQLPMGRPVALKVMKSGEDPGGITLKRFQQEALVVANLPHPNICQVYDFGQLPDGSLYLVMERLEGESLAEHIRDQGRVSVLFAVELGIQVLSALGFAHKRSVVHRDIKPENIFLARSGGGSTVKLLDFGLSKLITPAVDEHGDEFTQLTRAGITMGTPYYMAPEQAFGDRNLDARVDLWAVGVTMFEALAGRRPFTAANRRALMKSIVTDKHPQLTSYRPDVPPELELILDKALTKNRDERYPTASAFKQDLLAMLKILHDQRKGRSSGSSPGGTPSGVPPSSS